MLDIFIYGENSWILLEIRGQSLSDDAALPNVCYFSSFSANISHFSLSWLKMADFEGDNQVKTTSVYQSNASSLGCISF